MVNRCNKKVIKARDVTDLLRDIVDRYEAWKASLSAPRTPPADGDAREVQEYLEEMFGPDPHPLVTSLQEAVSSLVWTAHQRLLARPGEAATRLIECYKEGRDFLKNGPDISNSPVAKAIVIDLFVVRPMVSLCCDLANEFEAQQAATGTGRSPAIVPSDKPSKPNLDEMPDNVPLPPKTISELSGIPYELLRKRLERLRRERDDCFIEVADRKSNEPRCFYWLGSIRPLIAELKSKMSSACPAPEKSC